MRRRGLVRKWAPRHSDQHRSIDPNSLLVLSVFKSYLFSPSRLASIAFPEKLPPSPQKESLPLLASPPPSNELPSPSRLGNSKSIEMAGEENRGWEEAARGVLHEIEESTPVVIKELLAGGVAGGVAKTAVAPLERVKILFQTRRADFHGIGLFGSFQKIIRTEGVLGFYRGNGASVARIVPYAALHYMAYEQYRRWIILGFPDINRGPVLDLVSGSIAGGTAVLCTYPLDLVRTKLAYQVIESSKLLKFKGLSSSDQVYHGIRDCMTKIYKKNGTRGLYRGVGPSLYGIFPYSGLKFYFFEEMKAHVPEEHKKDIVVKLACGSVAGLLGQTITYPLDVVRRQMQVHSLSTSTDGVAKGTFETLVMIVQNQGWRQLFSGLSINFLKVVPSVAIGFTVYDVMKSWLKVPARDEISIKAITEERKSHASSSSSSWQSG